MIMARRTSTGQKVNEVNYSSNDIFTTHFIKKDDSFEQPCNVLFELCLFEIVLDDERDFCRMLSSISF